MDPTNHIGHLTEVVRRHATAEGREAVERACTLILTTADQAREQLARITAERDSLERMYRAVVAQATADQEAVNAAHLDCDERLSTIQTQHLTIANLEGQISTLYKRLAVAIDRATLAEAQAATATEELRRHRAQAIARTQMLKFLTATAKEENS